jgi:hypothetical protein
MMYVGKVVSEVTANISIERENGVESILYPGVKREKYDATLWGDTRTHMGTSINYVF